MFRKGLYVDKIVCVLYYKLGKIRIFYLNKMVFIEGMFEREREKGGDEVLVFKVVY